MGNKVEKRLELVHFQLTRNCNLRCWFCGQWGRRGFFAGAQGEEMTFADWKRVAGELAGFQEKPDIMLWGGEPLVYPDFERIVRFLREKGFSLGLVTNGVFLDRHASLCRDSFERIYVSVDGNREIHDAIRGEGVFDRVLSNLALLKGGRAEIVIMAVITPALLEILPEFPRLFEPYSPQKILLQQMIAFSGDEIKRYKAWLLDAFGRRAKEIDAWENDPGADFWEKQSAALKELSQNAYPFPVVFLPHGADARQGFCLSPFRHAHIAWNGEVMFCTDFYDFSAGNVKKESLSAIFENEQSEKFRSEIAGGKCAACERCSWKNNESFFLAGR